jgi:exosortase
VETLTDGVAFATQAATLMHRVSASKTGPVVAGFAVLWLLLILDLRIYWNNHPQYGYGWCVPLLALYFFWMRWQRRPKAEPTPISIWEKILVLAGVLALVPIHFVLQPNLDWRLLLWGFAAIVAGLCFAGLHYVGGRRWAAHFAFPILFMLVAVPWLSTFEFWVTQGLMRHVSTLTVEAMNILGIPAIQHGNLIQLAGGVVGVNEACSGIRSLQATIMASLFLGELYLLSIGRRVLLLVAGAFAAFLCNLGRAFFLAWITAKQGTEATARMHDPAGFTVLVVATILVWGIAMFLHRGMRRAALTEPGENAVSGVSEVPLPAEPTVTSSEPRAIPSWIPIAGAAWLLAGAVGTFFWFQWNESRAAKEQMWTLAWPKSNQGLREVPIADRVKELLAFNEGSSAAWTEQGAQWLGYFFRWDAQANYAHLVRFHRPDICFNASGMTQQFASEVRFAEANGHRLPYRAYIFKSKDRDLYVFYFLWRGEKNNAMTQRHLENNYDLFSRFYAARLGQRDSMQQVFELIMSGPSSMDEADAMVRAALPRLIQDEGPPAR